MAIIRLSHYYRDRQVDEHCIRQLIRFEYVLFLMTDSHKVTTCRHISTCYPPNLSVD
jgi:hypothetical protein